MGKLYDKQDMEYDLACIDKLEQGISQQIIAGTFPALRAKQATDECEKERQRCKMKLLRSGQLVADLRGAMALFRACPHCYEAGGKQHPCDAHKLLVNKAKRAIKFAVDDNEARRGAMGQTRNDEHNSECNEWETWYWADKRNHVWPGNTPEELAYNKEQFDRLDYRGWLNMLYFNEEMSYDEFRGELARLREGGLGYA